MEQYDVVLDCTDHPTSRYLISDAAVIARKPLVSASALKTEGQLLVLNWPVTSPETNDGGFCYRCVFPKPPPIKSVVGCGEGGILGPVVGVMGVLMAVETIKIIVKFQSAAPKDTSNPSLLLYSAFNYPPFRSVRLRGKRPTCPSCSTTARTITRQSLLSGSLDYASFCGVLRSNPSNNNLLPTDRISATEYSQIHPEAEQQSHILVDVREKPQFDICHLQHSINLPFSALSSQLKQQPPPPQNTTSSNQVLQTILQSPETPIYVLCRFGNDSQLAVQQLKAWAQSNESKSKSKSDSSNESKRQIRDIKGGLEAWRREVDSRFPEY